MFHSKLTKNSIEALEARIAPAGIPLLPTSEASYVKASFGAAVEVKEGQVLTTGGLNSGTYLLFVEKGDAFVFFTDLNNNRSVEFNEISGISAGDGLQLTSFVDIHGDIVTNLSKQTAVFQSSTGVPEGRSVLSLSDSDGNPSNDRPDVRGDGRVLLNSTIEKIELRRLQLTDIPDQNADGLVDDLDIIARQGPTTFSIFGNIYAGAGFGLADGTGGLIINTAGATNFGFETNPSVGSIKTGTAASGEFFSFGASVNRDVNGTLVNFVPRAGQAGADINGVRAVLPEMTFNINGLYAGDGGIGARGGNIQNVTLSGDDSGGYQIVAGNGGRGTSGGAGGSIVNFSDLASVTGEVLLRTGTGGVGANGIGGNGGTLSLGTFNVRGDVVIDLGDGGNGFTAGGNGAGLLAGSFTEPDIALVSAGIGFGTYHPFYAVDPVTKQPVMGEATGRPMYQPNIGTHAAIDFNKDGFGDFVFTTTDTSQVIVLLGKEGGFDRISLSGVRNPGALTVSDLNGDGQLDIAVASSDVDAQGKIAVFLSRFENDGGAINQVSLSQDQNRNGLNDFVDFRDVRYSTLPQIERITTDNSRSGFVQSPIQISNLSAGDFDGDGYAELAVVATFYEDSTEMNGVTQTVAGPSQILFLLTPEVERDNIAGRNRATGQFYADFGTKGNTPDDAVPRFPLDIVPDSGAGGTVILEASALSAESTGDVVFASAVGSKSVSTYSYEAGSDIAVAGTFALGKVDTNRTPANGENPNTTAEDVTLLRFTVVDLDSDGNADLGVLASTPQAFFVGVAGDGTGNGTQVSGDGADQSGNAFLTNPFGDLEGPTPYPLIKSADLDGDGTQDELFFFRPGGPEVILTSVEFAPGPQGATIITSSPGTANAGGEPFAADFYYYQTADISQPFFAYTDPTGEEVLYIDEAGTGLFVNFAQTYIVGLELSAGDGGNALIGKGGIGGSLGGGAKLVTTVDPVSGLATTDLLGTVTLNLSGDVLLTAGDGGDGFSDGGKGGSVDGVSVRFNGALTGLGVTVVAGAGGRGVSGVGGAGGDILGVSIQTSLTLVGSTVFIQTADETTLIAGDGGQGVRGGKGGSVIGNGSTTIPDAITSDLTVVTGKGGDGTKGGGSGGDISNLAPTLRRPENLVGSANTGSLEYEAGAGGNAVSGPGGNGGSILNSSPRPNARLDFFVIVTAGDGGDGKTGGNGGSISGFAPTLVGPTPRTVFMLAGQGGDGTTGNGGAGGGVSSVNIPSRGNGLASNRILAGDGGDSSGKFGGVGGNITNVISSSPEGSFALAAGAGGDGLKRGGLGGSVTTAVISLGSSPQAKGLIIAGAGGDASAFIPNAGDRTPNQVQNAFGGTIGRGGNGGSIVDFSDGGNIGSHVDLIAGNGGSTLNFGTVTDVKNYVGVGGSIRDIRLTGNAGQIDPNIPIKSYNAALSGETIAEFVQSNLREEFGVLNDALGNVGVVVGAAGRNKAVVTNPNEPLTFVDQPAQGSRNGSLIDFAARNLMSAVAGSVDRIASIFVAQNIRIPGGIIGADKVPLGERNYLDRDGNPTRNVVLDGRLVDGALVAGALLDARGKAVTLPSERVFIKPA